MATTQSDEGVEGPIDERTLEKYLQAKNINYESITTLSGGTANYIYLITASSGERHVLKHAEPYVRRSNGTIPFKVERMDFENRAMVEIRRMMQQQPLDDECVIIPEIIRYDKESKVLMMPYAGAKTLKEAYAQPDVDVPKLGRQLGEWLATLHHSSKNTDIGEGGNPTAKAIYRWPYSHLVQVAEKYGLNVKLAKRINEEYGPLLQTDNDCVCHGDFWPGNILLDDDHRMTVVDWEMCRRGSGATDVGQFAAETFLLDQFCGGRGLHEAFLSAYRDKMSAFGVDIFADLDFLKRATVHAGVHLAFWPASVTWGGKEDTRQIMYFGHIAMELGAQGDPNWIQCLFTVSLLPIYQDWIHAVQRERQIRDIGSKE